MKAFLGIGTNIGVRMQNLADAISSLNLLHKVISIANERVLNELTEKQNVL